MAYAELIKNFERVRNYMREFYVYGFKSRDRFEKQSARSYDNERRRIENYLGDYVSFRHTKSGKTVLLSIDSRSTANNPLYQALKAKSFTDGDITLHFILMDLLYTPEVSLSFHEITERIDTAYLCEFDIPTLPDISTVRKKLNEYVRLGLFISEKRGRERFYRRAADLDLTPWRDALAFFSEAGLCGVIGSFLLDRTPGGYGDFLFKHHYITHAMESEVLYGLLDAISQKRAVTIEICSRTRDEARVSSVIPLKIFVSVQSGRQYLMGYNMKANEIRSCRLDFIQKITAAETAPRFDELREILSKMQNHMWGVSLNRRRRTEHVEFTVRINENEEYIYRRLEREKRCGTVERLDRHTCRFTADVYDTYEMIPWIRTFICRILSMNFSNRTAENQFKQDLEQLYTMYGIGGGEDALS